MIDREAAYIRERSITTVDQENPLAGISYETLHKVLWTRW